MTETHYFKYVKAALRDSMTTITIENSQGNPLTLVKFADSRRRSAGTEARRLRDDNLAYDSVWCVTDVDDHPKLPEAKVLAGKLDIGLAISNPCFELWALLHLDDCRSHLTTDAAGNKLKTWMPSYGKLLDHTQIEGKYTVARARAIDLSERHHQNGLPADSNPSTDVYKLVDELIAEGTKISHPGPLGTFGL